MERFAMAPINAMTRDLVARNFAKYAAIALALLLANLIFNGVVAALHSDMQGFYSFPDAKKPYIVSDVLQELRENNKTANQIVNKYMNSREEFGREFKCWATILCTLFEGEAGRRSYVERFVLREAVEPSWTCLNTSRIGSEFVQLDKAPPDCMRLIMSVSTDSNVSVSAANRDLSLLFAQLKSTKDELELGLVDRTLDSVFKDYQRLIDLATTLTATCSHNASGMNYCDDISVSAAELGGMRKELTVARETTRTSDNPPSNTLLHIIIGSLFAAAFLVASRWIFHSLGGHLAHGIAHGASQGPSDHTV
jgi:hypothetical protein